MGTPFQDPVAGQGGTLVYPNLHSPNYVPGQAGWSINQDGTAEFGNAVVRGTLSGTNWALNDQGLFFYGN
jgi:hypothetical protein